MKAIPDTEDALVLRTDFSNSTAWEAICTAIRQPVGEFQAYVEFLSDPEYEGASVKQVLSAITNDYSHNFLFIVDQVALTHPEQAILVVDLDFERGRTFRVIPSAIWEIENNLSIANMEFDEFAESTDSDGVFRGFPQED